MTIIAAAIYGQHVALTSDSLTSSGTFKIPRSGPGKTWIATLSHERGVASGYHPCQLVIGIAGSIRQYNLVQYGLREMPRFKATHKDPGGYLHHALVPELRRLMREGGYDEKAVNQQGIEYGPELLIGFPGSAPGLDGLGMIYAIHGDYAVTEHDDFAAQGSGAPYALAADFASMGMLARLGVDYDVDARAHAVARIENAAQGACRIDSGCGGELETITTEPPATER